MDEAKKPSTPGRFVLGRLLGSGGMATVVEAIDLSLSRQVAVKQIKPTVAANPEMRDRFLEEARLQASLNHPGLVPVYDAGDLGGDRLFCAMQKIEGKTFSELLRSRTDSEVRDRSLLLHLVDILTRVCETVAYAHSQGVIHRDLKPANVMVDDLGRIYVMDWGLAKRLDAGPAGESSTLPGAVMGTPGYMPPEQQRGIENAGPRSDVFALGVILYVTLTGRFPFEAGSNREIFDAVSGLDPKPPAQRNPAAGRELSAICMKALHKDPARRYPTARELAEDLRRHREFLPVSAIAPRLVDRAANWVRRHRPAAAALGTLLAAGLLVGAWSGLRAWERQRTVGRVLAAVAATRSRVDAVEADLAAERGRLAGIGPGTPDRRAAERRIEDLRARLGVEHMEMRGLLGAALGMSLADPDPGLLAAARAQTIHLVEMTVANGNLPTARALAATALEGVERGNFLRFSPAEIARLQVVREGDAASRAPGTP